MFKGWGKEDPPTQKKLAVEVDLPEFVCKMGLMATKQKVKAVGNWTLIAFYYLLRIGEYTVKRNRNETKQTEQFRMMDVAFFKRDEAGNLRLLPPNAPDRDIMSADGSTLRLTNQKNGYKNACVHQQHNGHEEFSPVRALGRVYCHIRKHTSDPKTYLSAYFEEDGVRRDITDDDIRKAVKLAAIALNYPANKGIPVEHVDTHSLRAGGAMALHLSGYSDREIQKMGRWRGETFKEYISEQLSSFTKGMSKNMMQRVNFVNVEGGMMKSFNDFVMAAAA